MAVLGFMHQDQCFGLASNTSGTLIGSIRRGVYRDPDRVNADSFHAMPGVWWDQDRVTSLKLQHTVFKDKRRGTLDQ